MHQWLQRVPAKPVSHAIERRQLLARSTSSVLDVRMATRYTIGTVLGLASSSVTTFVDSTASPVRTRLSRRSTINAETPRSLRKKTLTTLWADLVQLAIRFGARLRCAVVTRQHSVRFGR